MVTLFGRQQVCTSACESVSEIHQTRQLMATDFSSCEEYVAIIVSSMPAVASVPRGRLSVPHVLAGLRDRLLFKSRFAVPRSEANDTYQSRPGVYPSDEAMIATHHARDGDYLQLSDGQRAEDYELKLVKTEIQGAVDGRRVEEEGVVRKSVVVH